MRSWTYTAQQLPPEGKTVVVLNGHLEQELIYERGLWWTPDRAMYVYFTPTMWRARPDGSPDA